MDCVDLALGEFGSCSSGRSLRLALAGSDGRAFPFGSGRELAIDFSLEMNDTIFAVLCGRCDWKRVFRPFRLNSMLQYDIRRFEYAIVSKNVSQDSCAQHFPLCCGRIWTVFDAAHLV